MKLFIIFFIFVNTINTDTRLPTSLVLSNRYVSDNSNIPVIRKKTGES